MASLPTPSIQYSWDGPGEMGPAQDGQALLWDDSAGQFLPGSAGISDHGGLSGLGDDDHTQYPLLTPASSARNTVQPANGSSSALSLKLHASPVSGQPLFTVRNSAGAVLWGAAYDGYPWSNVYWLDDPWSGATKIATNPATGTVELYPFGQLIMTVKAYASPNVLISAHQSTAIPLVVSLAAGHSANGFELRNSAGTALASISAAGAVTAAGVTAAQFYQNSNAFFLYLAQIRFREASGSQITLGLSANAISATGRLTIAPDASTSGSPTALLLTGPAHTTLAAGTEAVDVDLALNRTVQFATGAIATQRAMVLRPPTYGFVGASVITNAVTLDVLGGPVAGTNATLTNSYGIRSTASVATQVPLAVQAAASQTGYLTAWLDNTGTALAFMTSGGKLRVAGGTGTNPYAVSWGAAGDGVASYGSGDWALLRGGVVQINFYSSGIWAAIPFVPGSASGVPVTVKGLVGQTGNLTEWQSSAGAILARMSSGGHLLATGGTWDNVGVGCGHAQTGLAYGTSAYLEIAVGGNNGITQWNVNGGTVPTVTFTGTNVLTKPVVRIRHIGGATAHLTQWTDSTGVELSVIDNAGRFLAPLGALATCGLAFLGDPNTGLYSAGADVLSLVAGGVDRLKVNATGLGFFAATPVARQAFIADPSGGATVDAEARTAVAAIITALENYGLLATS